MSELEIVAVIRCWVKYGRNGLCRFLLLLELINGSIKYIITMILLFIAQMRGDDLRYLALVCFLCVFACRFIPYEASLFALSTLGPSSSLAR